MALLRKLLGRDAAALRADADGLFGKESWGEARLAYQRLLDMLGDDSPEAERAAVRGRIDACQTELVRVQLAEVERLVAAGEAGEALDLCRSLIEMADGLAIKAEVKARADALTEDMTRVSQPEPTQPTEDETYAALAGAWSDEQAEELDSYGEEFRRAFLALHEGRADEARDALRRIREAHPEGLYLRLEMARALGASRRRNTPAGDVPEEEAKAEATAALAEARDLYRSYLEDEPEDAPLDLYAAVQSELAQVLFDLGEAKAAEECLIEAAEATHEQTYGHLNLGRFYRLHGRHAEAIERLEIAVEKMGVVTPDIRVYRELGFAHRDAGHRDAAIECLQAIVDHQASLGTTDFDPETAVVLAELYLEAGSKDRASDLYRHLARGRDVANRFRYHLLAGKLLKEIGRKAEGVRELRAAHAIAPFAEAKAEAAALLGGPGPGASTEPDGEDGR